jgi:hypothetical protein
VEVAAVVVLVDILLAVVLPHSATVLPLMVEQMAVKAMEPNTVVVGMLHLALRTLGVEAVEVVDIAATVVREDPE